MKAFEVVLTTDGTVLHSALDSGTYPEPDDLILALQAHLDKTGLGPTARQRRHAAAAASGTQAPHTSWPTAVAVAVVLVGALYKLWSMRTARTEDADPY